MTTSLWFVLAYLLGAIPTSHWVARGFRGIDLREHGSGNLGATNLYRVLGWRYAVPVGLFDIAKGAIPTAWFTSLAHGDAVMALALGLTAVLGHVFSVFVGFRGGKGVATGAGVVLGLLPLAFAVAVVAWGALLFLTGYVSVASIAAAAIFPVAGYLLHPEARYTLWLQLLLAVAVIVLHRANVRRLLNGTEPRFRRRSEEGTS